VPQEEEIEPVKEEPVAKLPSIATVRLVMDTKKRNQKMLDKQVVNQNFIYAPQIIYIDQKK